MERHVLWTPWEEPGLEHLHFTYNNENIIGNSVILGVDMQEPFRVQYEIRCDSNWELRNVRLNTMSHSPLTLSLIHI